MAAAADIGAVPAQTGALITAARPGLQVEIGIAGLPVPGGQMTDRHSIVRMVPWMAGPEAIVMPTVAGVSMVMTMGTATVAPAPVLMQTVGDSAAVIATIAVTIILSALLPGADPFSGNHDSQASVGIKSVLTACLVSSREKRRIRCQ